MKYRAILSTFAAQPLAILPAKLLELREFLATKAKGEDVPADEVEHIALARKRRKADFAREMAFDDDDYDEDLPSPSAASDNRHRGAVVRGKVAVMPIFGVLAQRVGLLEAMSGGLSTEAIGATLDGLMADNEIRSIVLAFDSPGGSVFGIPELASKILAARDRKKIIAVADSVAASAAYWLASQATEVVVTPGGQVGSIGVIAAHTDVSKLEEMAGLKTTLVTSSPYKAEFAPEVALSPEAQAELQGKVDHYHAMFVQAIAKGRQTTEGRVRADFGQGRMVVAKDAVERGMADRVATLQQVLSRLGASGVEEGARAEVAQPGIGAKLAAVRARAVEVAE